MPYRAVGAEPESADEKLDRVLANQADDARKRHLTLVFGVMGALFAAAKLGVVAIPLIKERRSLR